MTQTQQMSYRLVTGAGIVHSMTAGRTYRLHGVEVTNKPEFVTGKADCGALTSSAARHTESDVTCEKCLARA